MKVLIVGGSGRVATWTAPSIGERHKLRVLDVVPPRAKGVEFVEGSITDPGALRQALDGMDTFVNMVMKSPDLARQQHGDGPGYDRQLQRQHPGPSPAPSDRALDGHHLRGPYELIHRPQARPHVVPGRGRYGRWTTPASTG